MISAEWRTTGQPKIGLRLALVWLLVASGSVVYFEPAPYDVLAMLLVFSFVVLGKLRIPTRLAAPLFFLGIFLFANFLSAAISTDPPRTIWYLSVTTYLMITWVFFTCLVYENPERVLGVIWKGYFVAAAIAVITTLLGYYQVSEAGLGAYGRGRGLFKDANVYGPFLIPIALYLFARFDEKLSRPKAAITLTLFAVMVVGVLLSFSRAAWGNLIGSILVFTALRAITSKSGASLLKLGVGSVVIMGIMAGVVIYALSTSYTGEFLLMRAKVTQVYDAKRFGVQMEAVEVLMKNPLGIGPGRSEVWFRYATHSVYLRVFVENGWVGGIGFIGFLVLTLWRGFWFIRGTPQNRDNIVVFACIVGILVNSVVIDSLHWRHFWLLLGMLWGPMLARHLRMEHQPQIVNR